MTTVSPAVLYRRSLESRPAVTSEAIPAYVPPPAEPRPVLEPKPDAFKLAPVLGHEATMSAFWVGGGGRWWWMGKCSCGWVLAATRYRTRKKAVAAMRRRHLDLVEVAAAKVCPTPQKRRFKKRETAERHVEDSWDTSWTGYAILCRVYECRCGYWHTTSKSLREQKPCV